MPGSQVAHVEQLVTFVLEVKVPLAHVVHVRSLVVVPVTLTRVPAEQVVQGTHAVAEF